MNHRLLAVLVLVSAGALLVAASIWSQDQPPTPPPAQTSFTGEILPVLYAADVRKSVAYYRDVLGFRFDHYFNHHDGGSVTEWDLPDEPLYAEMWAASQRFALHLAKKDYEKRVGGVIHYFRVHDVDAHRAKVIARGGEPSEVIDRPWMRMFHIDDPDGHRLFFYTPPENDS